LLASSSILFPDRSTEVLGYMEMCEGLGAVIGPALGSTLYLLFGFTAVFLI